MQTSRELLNYLESAGCTYSVIGLSGILFVEFGNISFAIDRINKVRYEITCNHRTTSVLGVDSVINFIEGVLF